MLNNLDTRPRTVRFRINLPGKIMMRVLESRDRLMSGQTLIELYKDEAHVALYSAALALHLLPRHGESKNTRYGAVLADTGDFLRFRFRAKVPIDTGKAWTVDDEVIADATDRELVDYVIKRLDGLCHQFSDGGTVGITELLKSLRQLRELLKIAARRLYPGNPEEYADYEAMFAESQQRPML
ncbi:MAG: hypothetical protein O2783_08310 [Chloroflexi bacterium]|nr:hypothetical protein [Chloroflexota bacterium]